jgi:hypothetical protein
VRIRKFLFAILLVLIALAGVIGIAVNRAVENDCHRHS